MNLERAEEQAHAVRGPQEAANLHYDISHELEGGGDGTQESYEAGERALAHLEQRYPDVHERAANITRPPRVSTRAKQNLDARDQEHEGRRHTASSGGERHGSRSRPRPSKPAARRPASTRARSSSGAPRRIVEQATGVTGDSVASNIIGGLRWLLLAGLAYQVLQPKGSGAFSGILSGGARAFRVLVDPVDPFTAFTSYSSLQAQANAGGNAATGVGTTDQSQFMATPIHPLATKPVNPLTQRVVVPGVTPRLATGAAGSHVKQPTSPLAIGSNPLGG